MDRSRGPLANAIERRLLLVKLHFAGLRGRMRQRYLLAGSRGWSMRKFLVPVALQLPVMLTEPVETFNPDQCHYY